jgi:hypothetical protein
LQNRLIRARQELHFWATHDSACRHGAIFGKEKSRYINWTLRPRKQALETSTEATASGSLNERKRSDDF